MVHETGMQLIRQLGTALCLCGGFLLISCDDKERETNFNQFLSEHDPTLKSKRDEIVTMIAEIKDKRGRLRTAKSQYKSEAARAEVDRMIQQVDAELEHMQAKLAAIDSKIELAMVAKDARSADAGGLRSAESKELSENADAVLKQANELRNFLRSEGDNPGMRESIAPHTDRFARSGPKAPGSGDPKTREMEDEAAKLSGNGAAALEVMKKTEAAHAAARNTPGNPEVSPSVTKPKTAKPAVDREAIQKEIRRLDASIANNEANLNQAWARIKQITRNGTVPIVKGSRQHVEYISAHRVLEECEAQLPDLKNRREMLKGQIESK
jgi:uncharacterized coiled-coil DUF342 family protein